MSVAHTIRCDACGGTIPLPALVPRIACPFCATLQHLPEARLRALAEYEREVASHLDHAAHERAQAARWQAVTGGRGPRSVTGTSLSIWLFAGIFVFALVVSLVAQTLMRSADSSLRNLGNFMVPIGVPILLVVLVTAYLVWYHGGRRRKEPIAPLPSTTGGCPRCGAANALAPGQVLARCAYCGASLLPSPTMMTEGHGSAALARHRAELMRYRAERTGMALVMRSSVASNAPLFIVGSWLPLTFGMAISFTFSSPAGGDSAAGLAVIWMLAMVNLAILGAVVLRRRVVTERWTRVMAVATRSYVCRPLVGLGGLVDWLNAYWAGPVPLLDLFAGAQLRSSSIVIGEFMGAIVLNPTPISPHYEPYAAVYLAAWLPPAHDPPPNAVAALARFGFDLTLDGAGLRAQAPRRVTARLAKSGRGGEDLAAVAQVLLLTAQSMGARALPAER